MPKYKLIDKTKDYIVIEKPSGLLTHGAPHISEDSAIEQLSADFPEIKRVGEDPYRPGIMHRLDKLASGLLVVALNQESFDDLKAQFKARTVDKYYTALAHGQISKDDDSINFPIQRSAKGHKMAALPATYKGHKTEEGRIAITEFSVLKRYVNYTLLDVKIKTGRTHQIRAHMAAYGNPLVGDDLYGTKKTKVKNAKLGIKRILLAATRLGFNGLDGERKTYETGLPDDFKNFLDNIKKQEVKMI